MIFRGVLVYLPNPRSCAWIEKTQAYKRKVSSYARLRLTHVRLGTLGVTRSVNYSRSTFSLCSSLTVRPTGSTKLSVPFAFVVGSSEFAGLRFSVSIICFFLVCHSLIADWKLGSATDYNRLKAFRQLALFNLGNTIGLVCRAGLGHL